MNWLKKWIPIAFLAAAPLAYAQNTEAMDSAKQVSADVVLAATPQNNVEEQQIDDLRKELDAVRSELNAQRERDDRRQELLGDPNDHPLWP